MMFDYIRCREMCRLMYWEHSSHYACLYQNQVPETLHWQEGGYTSELFKTLFFLPVAVQPFFTIRLFQQDGKTLDPIFRGLLIQGEQQRAKQDTINAKCDKGKALQKPD